MSGIVVPVSEFVVFQQLHTYIGFPNWKPCMQALERLPAVSKWTSSIFLSMACAAALSHLGVLPHACAAYGTVWNVLMPLGTALLLLRSPSLFVPLATRLHLQFIPGKSTTYCLTDTISQGESEAPVAIAEATATGTNYMSIDTEGTSTVAVTVATPPAAETVTEIKANTTTRSTTALSQQHLIAFAAATAATLVGTIVAWVLVGRGAVATGAVDHTGMAALAAALCASYIGGSVNFAAIIQV